MDFAEKRIGCVGIRKFKQSSPAPGPAENGNQIRFWRVIAAFKKINALYVYACRAAGHNRLQSRSDFETAALACVKHYYRLVEVAYGFFDIRNIGESRTLFYRIKLAVQFFFLKSKKNPQRRNQNHIDRERKKNRGARDNNKTPRALALHVFLMGLGQKIYGHQLFSCRRNKAQTYCRAES